MCSRFHEYSVRVEEDVIVFIVVDLYNVYICIYCGI
jgi:hypothetical protein